MLTSAAIGTLFDVKGELENQAFELGRSCSVNLLSGLYGGRHCEFDKAATGNVVPCMKLKQGQFSMGHYKAS